MKGWVFIKIYIVFENINEAHEYYIERIFIEAFLNERDAQDKVEQLKRPYNEIYYEEILVK